MMQNGETDFEFWNRIIPADPGKFLIEVEQCYNCSSTHLRALSPLKPARLLRCRGCGLVFTSPRISDQMLDKIYAKNPGELTQEAQKALDTYMKSRYLTFKKEMFHGGENKRQSLLDIGCGWGHFLKHAGNDFTKVMGIELSKRQSDWARAALGLTMHCGDLFSLEWSRKFSAITLWEVIEHVTNPPKLLEWCYERLEPGGQLILSTPNFNSIFRMLLGTHWYYFIPTQHLTYFTPASMQFLLRKVGFKKCKAVTSGRSFLRERSNNHNQIDTSLSLRDQWVQSFNIRSRIELDRAGNMNVRGIVPGLGNRIFWHIFNITSKLGLGEQMRMYALKE